MLLENNLHFYYILRHILLMGFPDMFTLALVQDLAVYF